MPRKGAGKPPKPFYFEQFEDMNQLAEQLARFAVRCRLLQISDGRPIGEVQRTVAEMADVTFDKVQQATGAPPLPANTTRLLRSEDVGPVVVRAVEKHLKDGYAIRESYLATFVAELDRFAGARIHSDSE